MGTAEPHGNQKKVEEVDVWVINQGGENIGMDLSMVKFQVKGWMGL